VIFIVEGKNIKHHIQEENDAAAAAHKPSPN
jgi:hypothetical protein